MPHYLLIPFVHAHAVMRQPSANLRSATVKIAPDRRTAATGSVVAIFILFSECAERLSISSGSSRTFLSGVVELSFYWRALFIGDVFPEMFEALVAAE
jgi:hypothetical protein